MIVKEIKTSDCTPQTIVIGRRTTYDTLQVVFDLSYLAGTYGSGAAVLVVKRSQDETAYPATITQDGNTLTWTISETDTYYVGAGECELMWYVNNGLAKTIIYPVVVMRDILQTAEEPPDGYENWIESLTALGAETQQNAQNAAQSASNASTAKNDAVTAKEAAKAAQQAAETAVTHYPKIENNYWMVWDVDSQSYVSTGIQAEGEDGYSPEISITTITGGHRVTITDKDHPQGQSFDVMDGQGGGGTSDYTSLINKPKINNVELDGNKTAHDLGLAAQSDIPTVPVQSVNGKTGAVNLASGDIAYDESETYQAGSVGAELQEQNRQLSDVEENQIPELKNAIDQLDSDLTLVQNNIGKLNGNLVELLQTILSAGIYSEDQSTNIANLANFVVLGDVASISAVYAGGTVETNTSIDDLRSDLTVTANYTDGTTETVTAYTLSGTIAVGTNIITVSYEGKTTTFTVVGVLAPIEITDSMDWESGKRLNANGRLYDDAEYSVSKVVDVSEYTSLRITTTSTTWFAMSVFYDGIDVDGSTTGHTVQFSGGFWGGQYMTDETVDISNYQVLRFSGKSNNGQATTQTRYFLS